MGDQGEPRKADAGGNSSGSAGVLLALRRALAHSPDHPDLLADLGGLYLQMERHEEALDACQRALVQVPDHPAALANLAGAHQALGDHEVAEAVYRRILRVEPGSPIAHFNLGRLLALTDRGEEALVHLDQVLAANPSDGEARLNRGFALSRLMRFPEAIEEYAKARPLLANPAEVDWNLGILHLLQGDYRQGWVGYEARWDTARFKPLRRGFEQPRWEGDPFPGQTLLVHSEQGIGDTLMFSRFLPAARERGGRLVLEAPRELLGVLGTCAGIDELVPAGAQLPAFDLQVPLHSLGRLFGPDLEHIPGQRPYLAVPEHVPYRRELDGRLGAGSGRRIGLVWSGNRRHMADRARSIDPGLLARLGEVSGVDWFSLQVGGGPKPALPGLQDLAPLLADFSGTAYALSKLDLLVTVDTSVAHLAGALGRPVLLLLPHFPDWRWLLDRADSPWYPALRIHRQPRAGDWPAVLDQVASELQGR